MPRPSKTVPTILLAAYKGLKIIAPTQDIAAKTAMPKDVIDKAAHVKNNALMSSFPKMVAINAMGARIKAVITLNKIEKCV